MSLQVAGIDWGTKPKKQWTVKLSVDQHNGCVSVHTDAAKENAEAVCTNRELQVVGVDVPFGWPIDFVELVQSWNMAGINGSLSVAEDDGYRYRKTDNVVDEELRKRPLSVTSDLIAASMRAWLRLCSSTKTRGSLSPQIRVDRTEFMPNLPVLIEVYPAATLRAFASHSNNDIRWRTLIAGYKGKDSTEATSLRKELLAILGEMFQISNIPISSMAESADETDAFIAAITALIFAFDQTENKPEVFRDWTVRYPTAEELPFARREGWIFFPCKSSA
ncbi:MAG: DUF429 domain-containing protein [Candidatus Obscuribacterales bacterium]|nr:DUF429 domain-containing protein [Candidatus Obscuribacterales bacterium]